MAWIPKISLAPSAASRWMVCTASAPYILREHKRVPDDTTVWNTEGDHAHAVANAVLLNLPIPAKSKKGPIPQDKLPEMLKHAKGFKAYCLEDHPLEFYGEQNIKLFYMPDRNGYIDYVGVDLHRVKITDYKYGQGVSVSAEGNEQMAIYARSHIEQNLLNHWLLVIDDNTEIILSIYQPRCREGDAITEWKLTWKELKEFTDKIGRTAKFILSADPVELEFRPGPKTCQFCPARTFCDARNGKAVRAVATVAKITPNSKPVFVDPASLTPEQASTMLEYRTQIKTWLDDLYKLEYPKALKGDILPGFKLVAGKGSSDWKNKRDAADVLTFGAGLPDDTVHPRGMITPNKALLALKEMGASKALLKEVKDMVEKFSGKPTLVPVSDPRPSLILDPTQVMDYVDDDEPLTDEVE
jgi:hypothetical protein